MTQVSPERNFNSREDTLLKNPDNPTTSDVIILGEDHAEIEVSPYDFTHTYNPDFIGPRDATDSSRGFLTMRAKDLATIAVKKFSAYEGERARLVKSTRESVNEGTLRLGSDYPHLSADQQVEHFIMDSVNFSTKTKYEVESELAAERVAQNLGSNGPTRKLQEEVLSLKKTGAEQGARILKIRAMLEEGGATEEFMRKFYYVTKLMSKPDQEAYEIEMQLDPDHEETPPLVDTGAIHLLDVFKSVLRPSFGRKALRSIGILPPISGEVTVVKQQ